MKKGLPELREAFEAWATKNGYLTRYAPNAECGVEGGPVYAHSSTHAAWWAYRAGLEAGAKDKADAERYRWLRDQNDWYAEPRLDESDGTRWELVFYSPQRITDPTDDDNLDAAIDAAMKKEHP